MPELPDVEIYIEALRLRIDGQTLEAARLNSPFLLRTVHPPLSAAVGCKVLALKRVGKRIAVGLTGDLWIAIHLMIAGRLHWRKPEAPLKGRQSLAAFDFPTGSLVLTEAGSERRAGVFVAGSEADLAKLDAGGIDVLSAGEDEFRQVLTLRNHTLKRALTDPHLFSGIGNAYSDEILHQAKLSPVRLTQKLSPEETSRLYEATRTTLNLWIDLLRRQTNGKFPEKVTAFHPEMAVHGRYGQPCPVCGAKVQRIRYASNETNYCPVCQTGGRLLADRSLSRLLREDWPRRIEDME